MYRIRGNEYYWNAQHKSASPQYQGMQPKRTYSDSAVGHGTSLRKCYLENVGHRKKNNYNEDFGSPHSSMRAKPIPVLALSPSRNTSLADRARSGHWWSLASPWYTLSGMHTTTANEWPRPPHKGKWERNTSGRVNVCENCISSSVTLDSWKEIDKRRVWPQRSFQIDLMNYVPPFPRKTWSHKGCWICYKISKTNVVGVVLLVAFLEPLYLVAILGKIKKCSLGEVDTEWR